MFIKADYPLRFINNLNNEFQKDTDHGDENFIISPHLFGITKHFISTACLMKLNQNTF